MSAPSQGLPSRGRERNETQTISRVPMLNKNQTTKTQDDHFDLNYESIVSDFPGSVCSGFETRSPVVLLALKDCVAKDNLDPDPPAFTCLHRHRLPHSGYVVLEIEPGALDMLSKHCTN